MLIKYQPKLEHMKCVPLIPVNAGQKNIQLSRSLVQLLPGVNEVTDNEWEIMKASLAREIARGEITTIEKDVGKTKANPSGGKASNLKNMPVKEAAALVAECVNPDTLKKWYKEETREEIRLLIVEKMKELKVEIPKFDPNVDDDSDSGNGDKTIDEMTVDELKAYAAEKKITVSGNKEEIIAAIKKAEAK